MVSTIGQSLNNQFIISSLQNRLLDLQNQIATGKKGRYFSDYSSLDASNSIIYRRSLEELDTYQETINTVNARITAMDDAMLSIRDNADEAKAFLYSLIQDTAPQTGMITDELSQHLESVEQRLNTQFGDRYVFAGSDISNAPFDSPATLDTNFNTLVTTNMVGTPTVTSIVNDSRVFNDMALGLSTTLTTASNVTARIDKNTDIDYTVFANDEGFEDVLRGMSLVANLPNPTTQEEQDNFWTIVNGAISLLESGIERIDEMQGLLGNRANQLDEKFSAHADLQADFSIFIGDSEDADITAATIELQDLDLQLQSAYQLTAQLNALSLINFI